MPSVGWGICYFHLGHMRKASYGGEAKHLMISNILI